ILPDEFETARILLRPVRTGDAGAIFSTYAQDEDVVRYLIWRPHRNLSETQAYIQHCLATPPEVERTYMVVGREDNQHPRRVRAASTCATPPRLRICVGVTMAAAEIDDGSSD